MTITARYPGKCRKCGGSISVGEQIEWEKGNGASHVKCPEKHAQKPDDPNEIKISGGSGYGCIGWEAGQVILNPYHGNDRYKTNEAWRVPEYLIVLFASKRYCIEDGMSFGVGDEHGYIYSARCRAATVEEATPLIEAQRIMDLQNQAKKELEAIKKQIREIGEYPQGENHPEGDRWFDTQSIYGGGDWFVVSPEWIWYIQNNGMDGDDWSKNNVMTGGAGAIGGRVRRTDELEERLTKIRDTLAGKIEEEAKDREITAMVDDQMGGRIIDY
jgi:hypothetical protein